VGLSLEVDENTLQFDFPEGGAPAERLDLAFRKVLTVPKEALLREGKEKRPREMRGASKERADSRRPRLSRHRKPSAPSLTCEFPKLALRI
jgi:hypothetical protein